MVRKSLVKGFIFLIILIFIISGISPIFIKKTGHRNKLFQGLYMNTEDQYDVVLIGSSHMNNSINPNILWNQYGVTSFNYATGGQPLDVSYFLLREVLKKHKNPIVVVDLYYLGLTDQYGSEGYIRYVLDNLKFSTNKLEAIVNCTPSKDWIYYLFPFLKYHSRWKELKKYDFHYDGAAYYYKKGFADGREIYGKDNMSDLSITETADLPPKTEKYLYKIIELCKEKNLQLIFTNAPYDYTSTANMKNWHKEPAKMFNKVSEISKENNIPFINYCLKLDEIGFNFKSDMFNIGHLNTWGSNKVTLDLGKFLKENYDLVDHRNEEAYTQWNSDVKYYFKKEASKTIP